MTDFLFFWSTALILLWWLCPRIFLIADRHIMRRNISLNIGQQGQLPGQFATSTLPPKNQTHRGEVLLTEVAHALDTLARLTRSHVPTRDALTEVLSSLNADAELEVLLTYLRRGDDIATSLDKFSHHHQKARFMQLLRSSLVHGSFIPQALEQSAAIVREEMQLQLHIQSAAAQARSTVRLLSLLPFLVLGVLLFVSPNTRQELTAIPIVIVILVGITLNRCGWTWVQHMVARTSRTTPSLSSQMSDAVCIALRAGIPLREAVESWATEHDASLATSLLSGSTFAEALNEYAHRHPGDAHLIVRVLIDADRDGLPVVETIHRLSTEMRMQRRHSADIRLRELPTQLAFPVVFCVLPSFICLTVLPLILANLHHFHFSPPIINTTT